jgi:hypothetical protein
MSTQARQISHLDRVRTFLTEAGLPHAADAENISVELRPGTSLYLRIAPGAVYLYLPLLDDEKASETERAEGAALLAERVPTPIEFAGMAAYEAAEGQATGLLIEALMPRRFSPELFADCMDLAWETLGRVDRLAGG